MPLLLDLRLKWKAISVQTHVTTKSSTSLSHPFEHLTALTPSLWASNAVLSSNEILGAPKMAKPQWWSFRTHPHVVRQCQPFPVKLRLTWNEKRSANPRKVTSQMWPIGASGLDKHPISQTSRRNRNVGWAPFQIKSAWRCGAVRVLSLNLLLIFPGKMEGYLSWYGIFRVLCSWRDGQLSVLQESCSRPNMCSGHVLWDSKSFWKLHCAISIAKLKSLEAIEDCQRHSCVPRTSDGTVGNLPHSINSTGPLMATSGCPGRFFILIRKNPLLWLQASCPTLFSAVSLG